MRLTKKLKTKFGNFKETSRRARYAKYHKNLLIESKVILYDSYFGRSMICNPYALFSELINNPDFSDYTHVWAMEDRISNEPVIEEYDNTKVFAVARHSNDYLRYLASAEYIITNVSLPFYYCKKEGQVYINTWHGTPLKSLGFDMPGAASTISNVLRNFLSADYIISASPFLTDIYLNKYKLNGLFSGTIIEEGYPRNDLPLNTDKEDIIYKLQCYGIHLSPNKKIILYAPTWKGNDYYHPEVNVGDYLNFKKVLEENINTDEYQILLKPHQVVFKELLKCGKFDDSLIPAFVDTNELLSITDILVSDYSSIFYDFLVTDKPILFYIPDLDEYANYRGLYLDLKDLPGPAYTDLEAVADGINHLEAVKSEFSEKYAASKAFACPYDDGYVSKRLVDIMFRKNQSDANGRPYNIIIPNNDKKKLLLFGGGLRFNGISTALRTMLDIIDYDKYDVTVFAANLKFDDSVEFINTLDSHARTFSRIAYTPATFGEQIRNLFLRVFGFNFPLMDKIYPKKMYDREFKRCFGNSSFDTVVDYSGYGSFYSILLLSADKAKKLIWQHNDLMRDKHKVINHKKPHNRELRVVFSAYPYYDKIVGCSKDTMEVNLKKIGYTHLSDKCDYVRNAANFERVSEGIKESYSPESAINDGLPELLDKNLISFVNMGRLSPEKNQEMLIKAFAKLCSKRDDVRLYIIGDGALMEPLKELISSLSLEGKVILTGNLFNPFMIMKECDCFVLPSLYEGQPVSILEARVLGLPIIMSNFDSYQSSLIENGQLVISSDIDSIYDGMKQYIEGKVPTCKFDYHDYNNETIKKFEELVD